MANYKLSKTVEVTKEEFIKHIEGEIEYWRNRLHRTEDENQKALVKYQAKLNRREREISDLILRKKEELKRVMQQ